MMEGAVHQQTRALIDEAISDETTLTETAVDIMGALVDQEVRSLAMEAIKHCEAQSNNKQAIEEQLDEMAGDMVEASMSAFIKKVIAREGYTYCLFELALPSNAQDIIESAITTECRQVAD